MTNAEKFKEVFGFELCYGGQRYDYCLGEYSEVCKQRASCRGCPYEDWENKGYKKPCVQPKTGHWIAQDIYNCHTDFKCSECGYIHSFMHLYGEPTADYTYCPNCGCRMAETQESEE